MAIFLGVDGGGSKTACVVGDASSVLGRGLAGGSNLIRMGEVGTWETISLAIQQACIHAGIPTSQIRRACIGLAGSTHPELSHIASQTLGKLFQGEIVLATDAAIALHAAFGKAPGIVVIAGTGSIAYGRAADGTASRAGGWGFAVSDEGSGYWIGRAAVSAALHAFDEREGSAFLASLMSAWKLDTHEQMIAHANASPAPDFAGLFPAVVGASEAGDPIARRVLTQAGGELDRIAKIVIRTSFSRGEVVRVAMSGGVFQNSALVRESFYNGVSSDYPQAIVVEKPIDPVMGALQIAREGSCGDRNHV